MKSKRAMHTMQKDICRIRVVPQGEERGQHLIGRLLHLSRLFASARLGLVCFGFGFDLFALHCMSNNLLNNIAKTKDTVQVQYKIQLRISMS